MKHLLISVLVCAAAAVTVACDGSGGTAGQIEHIRATNTLRVVTRNAPTAYYLDRHKKPTGPETELSRAFAAHLGVDVEYIVKHSIRGVLKTLEEGKADMAAAGLSITPGRRDRFAFTTGYRQVRQQVVCNASQATPENVAELAGVKLEVIADSSYVERLQTLKKQKPDADLAWRENGKVGTEQLLRRVWEGDLDCTVADSNIVDINRRYYPQLEVMFDLNEPESLGWAMPENARPLAKTASDWLTSTSGKQARKRVDAHYYAYLPEFDVVDRSALVQRVDTKLPRYDPLFDRYGKKHGVPPLLLAAQAYQESKWDPTARSPTGVRGLMMLTRRTAKAMGVSNRLDPAQSVRGGAKYLAKMRGYIDESAPAQDRLFLALAAYNIGLAHLRDAQKLARRLNKNPRSWSDLKTVFPLLADKRYYPSLKYGYARGTEPVRYIRRIRDYEDVIRRHVQ